MERQAEVAQRMGLEGTLSQSQSVLGFFLGSSGFAVECNRIIQLSFRNLQSLHVIIQHKIDKIETMHYTVHYM